MNIAASVPQLPRLPSAISSYAVITGDGPLSKMIHPRPGATLVISLSGSYWVDGLCAPRAAVFGLRELPVRLEMDSSPIDRIQVQFTPCGLSRFSRATAASIKGRVAAAEEVLPAIGIESLICELTFTRRLEERAAALDRFFADHYAPPTALEEAIDSLAGRLCDDPDAELGALLRELPASLRHVERLFARLVGTSPRSFACIARFEQAKSRLLANGGGTLTEIGLAAGYYDQAHFGREFRRLAAVAPGSYTPCPAAS